MNISPLAFKHRVTLTEASKLIFAYDVPGGLSLLIEAVETGALNAEVRWHAHEEKFPDLDLVVATGGFSEFAKRYRAEKARLRREYLELVRKYPSGSIDVDHSTVTLVDLRAWAAQIGLPQMPAFPGNCGETMPHMSPVSRQEAQKETLLAAICNAGFDPKKLPRPPNGKAGVKSQFREELLSKRKDVFGSRRVFDDCWQRLRYDGEIGDARPSHQP